MILQLDWLMNNDGEVFVFWGEGVIFPKDFMLFGQTLWQTLVPWDLFFFFFKSKMEVLGGMDAVSLRCVPVWACGFQHKLCPSFLKNKVVSLSKIVIWINWPMTWKKQEVSRGQTLQVKHMEALYIMHLSAMKYNKCKDPYFLSLSSKQTHTQNRN